MEIEFDPRIPTSEIVEAACCIANNNKNVFGGNLYNIDKQFDGWKRDYIKKRINEKFKEVANL